MLVALHPRSKLFPAIATKAGVEDGLDGSLSGWTVWEQDSRD
jgi:hypothetical protein